MPTHYTEKNDPSGFLAAYRSEINLALPHVSWKFKKRLVCMLKNVIDRKRDLDDEMQDIEHEMFPEEYGSWNE